MVIHNLANKKSNKLRSNIYIYIYRLRQNKRLISAFGLSILIAISCGLIGIGGLGVGRAQAESSGSLSLGAVMRDLSLDITIPQNTVILNLDPTATLATADASVVVTTTAPYGYSLFMMADSSNLTRTTALPSGDYPTIPTIASGASNISVNHWGWKLPTDSMFHSFDNSGVQIGYSDAAVTEKEETITFGARTNSNTPIGNYQLPLTITALVNPKTPMTITDVNNMQAFKDLPIDDRDSILGSMEENRSYPLVDTRDNQTYYVAKLADGNIWMVQNLKLGKNTSSLALNSDTSDVNGSFTLNGKSSDGKFTDKTIDGVTAVNNDSQYYCTDDYGCYYNWYAATAGSGTSYVASGDVDYSICPAGWTLPTGGANGQFTALAAAYNNDITALLVNPTSATENTNGTSRPGLLVGSAYDRNGMFARGIISRYTTRTVLREDAVQVININTNTLDLNTTTAGGGKYQGIPVRCLVK